MAAWMLEALRRDYELTVFAWRSFDVALINRYWGTSLPASEVEVIMVPALVSRLVDLVPLPLSLLKNSLLMRFARSQVARYDLVLSANNEVDFGRPGIQYIHYPAYERPRPRVDMRWYHGSQAVLGMYYWLCDRIANTTSSGILDNLTLTNSDWTRERFQRRHGGHPRTVYPPVTGHFPDVSWEQRRNDFLCLGRISPEKNVEMVIDIVAAVRRVHPDVHLHIVGSPDHRRYFRQVVRRVRRHPEWITLHLDVTHEEVRRLITASRYGLHAMENEHFGMAPAEIATGGCIVWVRNDGGQVEIVGGDQRLIFHSPEDAVEKILETMGNAAQQASLRAVLASQVPQFAADRFVDGIRAAAKEQLARQAADSTPSF